MRQPNIYGQEETTLVLPELPQSSPFQNKQPSRPSEPFFNEQMMLNILCWLSRPFIYLFTVPVLLIVLLLSTTIVGLIFGYLILMVWISFYEWFHEKHDAIRGRHHRETFLSGFVNAYSGGAQAPRRHYH